MNRDLGWRADGIARARAAGGVELERYRRPGFTGEIAVRVVTGGDGPGGGVPMDSDPDIWGTEIPEQERRRV